MIANKITDIDTGMDYYPDVFFGEGIPQIPVQCYSKVVKSTDLTEQKELFCDMESAGIMKLPKSFSFPTMYLYLK
ncbi:hypothetical protein [Ruminiclostridium josui]|uniref:hypothetical protein n=1 Tax=Ruminiclostridium josui TaxID=1499 RepID=UPI000A889DC8|nr:hypothetical protein [Ruminiclostridium josui]